MVNPDRSLSEVVRTTFADRSVECVVETVAALVAPLRPTSVGVGVPGFVRGGNVVASPNFPRWREVDLSAELESHVSVPVWVENDANCAAWAAWNDEGQQQDLVLLTLGTGVGGGVITDGELLTGKWGTAAELGHIYAGGDALCGCGATGCLETLVSASGLIRAAHQAGHMVADAQAVFAAADRGEAWALPIVQDAVTGLARGLRTLVNIFSPGNVVIVGGVSLAPALRAAEVRFRREAIGPSQEHMHLLWGGRADDLAIRGAAMLAERHGNA